MIIVSFIFLGLGAIFLCIASYFLFKVVFSSSNDASENYGKCFVCLIFAFILVSVGYGHYFSFDFPKSFCEQHNFERFSDEKDDWFVCCNDSVEPPKVVNGKLVFDDVCKAIHKGDV